MIEFIIGWGDRKMYHFLKDKTALYVEDEGDVLKNISELLSNFFGVFYTAQDGELGYQIFSDHKIDVVLVDIELPKMNGIELMKKIREIHKDIPIVVISAYTKTDYLLESIELKLNQYIIKPLTSKKIHVLLQRLDKLFSNENVVELVSGVWLNKNTSSISFNQTQNFLTKKELKILSILADNRFISYDEINILWEDEIPTQNAIRSCIKHLRKKLPENLLKNRNGFGYAIESDE